MKQQEIFKVVYNMMKKFALVGIAVGVLAVVLLQQVYAAVGDPKFFFMERPVTSTVLVAGKTIPTVTFSVAAITTNGQGWNAKNSDRVYVDISASGEIGKQSFELSSSGSGTATFNNLIPNAYYKITASMGEYTPSGFAKRPIDGVIGEFQAPQGDSASETALFSYSQQPQTSLITQDGKSSSSVKLFITSKTDGQLAVVLSAGGGTLSQDVVFKKEETSIVTFTALRPNTSYNVMVARGSGTIPETYQQIAALGSFSSIGLPSVPSPSVDTPPVQSADTTNPTGNSTTLTLPRATDGGLMTKLGTTCTDGIDNDGDGRADYYGTDTMDPDPSCFSIDAEETADDVAAGSLVPCTNKCGLRDVFVLLNNVLKFFITKLLIPLFVVLIMYIGFQYLMSQGKPAMHAKFKKILWNVFIGLVLILSAWLIVRTGLSSIGVKDGLLFFD